MSTILSKRIKNVKGNVSTKVTGWDEAIADTKRRIARLQRAVETYEEGKASGEPWPGEEKAGTAA